MNNMPMAACATRSEDGDLIFATLKSGLPSALSIDVNGCERAGPRSVSNVVLYKACFLGYVAKSVAAVRNRSFPAMRPSSYFNSRQPLVVVPRHPIGGAGRQLLSRDRQGEFAIYLVPLFSLRPS